VISDSPRPAQADFLSMRDWRHPASRSRQWSRVGGRAVRRRPSRVNGRLGRASDALPLYMDRRARPKGRADQGVWGLLCALAASNLCKGL
jgi:hypothetical protein